MTAPRALPLDEVWKDRLDLSERGVPELFETEASVRESPHAGALRAALSDLGLSAVFCVQGVPTIAILRTEEYDQTAVIDLHASLWNQGLASLLLVIAGDTVRAFSLVRKPFIGLDEKFDDRCLLETLNAVANALEIKGLVYGAESGRLWAEHSEYFVQKERIDQVLLTNLSECHRLLCAADLSSDAAQALLIQAMFIAYLEDRDITDAQHYLDASSGAADSFSSLLESGNTSALSRLFSKLRKEFNGDLFVAPCSFDTRSHHPQLTGGQLGILARFRSGREEMAREGSQYRFWGYNFKYIPVELISAVYDRFLGEQEAKRREQGAYYTPMFLADTVISQVWDLLPAPTREKGTFLDPACGSGVFLVRTFQRLCENWRESRKSRKLRWDSLLAIISRLHGWDLNSGSVRVAVFSLYIALLEEVSPPEIRTLARRGRMLPELWGKTLRCQDFFTVPIDSFKFNVIIGNPPWSSRRGENRSSVSWCDEERLPMPSREDAWAFTWKSLRHMSDNGIVAFLLPAMGFLHNHATSTVAARKRLMTESRVRRIINFSDLRFQLFEGAVRPAALIVLEKPVSRTPQYCFDYWVPKADLNLRIKRLITLSSADKSSINISMAIKDPFVFKRRLWMSGPDEKLFNYMLTLPNMSETINEFGYLSRREQVGQAGWIIGQGFQPSNVNQPPDNIEDKNHSDIVATAPFLPIKEFTRLAQDVSDLRAWKNGNVRRKGFERGFQGPRVLIPRGISTNPMRLRAAYIESPVTFRHIIQAITVPQREKNRGKLLAALLNSKLAIWFAFHGTASFGSDRPVVQQAELLRLPFPSPEDTPNPEQSRRAAVELVQVIDQALTNLEANSVLRGDDSDLMDNIDRLTYEYFCLSADEVILIEDGVTKLIPAAQPSQSRFPDIWKPANRDERGAYGKTLVRSLRDWFDDGYAIEVALEAKNNDLAILRLTLGERAKSRSDYVEENNLSIGKVLSRISDEIHQPLPGNFQLIPDFRIFSGKHLYVVKLTQKRFWLRSAALADADAIALDLQSTATLREWQEHS